MKISKKKIESIKFKKVSKNFSIYDTKVGDILKLKNGDILLVGDINNMGGRCDCCRDVSNSDITEISKINIR